MNKIAMSILVALCASCSHNNATLDGQIFVVLENRESVKLSLTDVYSVSPETAVDIIKQITSQRNLELQKICGQEHSLGVSREWIELGFESIGLPGSDEARQARAKIERVQQEFKEKEDDALNLAKRAVSVKFTPAARTTTDVDGKFSISRPDAGGCLFAATTRQTGIKTQYFFWLTQVPRDSTHLMLTNKNMIDSSSPENFATSVPEIMALPARLPSDCGRKALQVP